MVCNYWMPVLISIFFVVINSVNGRPAESNIDNDLGDKNGVQILEFSSTDGDSENAHKNAILKKLFYNVSRAGLHIPVQVIYDSPRNFIKELLQNSSSNYDNDSFAEQSPNLRNTANQVPADIENKLNATWTQNYRNSRHRNLTDVDTIKENLKQYYFGKVEELTGGLVSDAETLKSINRMKNPLAFFINNRPEFLQKINETRKKVPMPVIFHFFSPAKNEQNDPNNDKVDHKYIIPILDKLKEINNNRNPTTQSTNFYQSAELQPQSQAQLQFSQATQVPQVPQLIKIIRSPTPTSYKNVAPIAYYYANAPVPYFGGIADSQEYISSSYAPYSASSYYDPSYSIYRPWPSPFGGYYPSAVRDLLQQPSVNYFSNLVDYELGTSATNNDICQRKYKLPNYERIRRTIDDESENDEEQIKKTDEQQQAEAHFEIGKRRYDEDPTIEYVNQFREKRNSNPSKMRRRYVSNNEIRRQETVAAFESKKTEPENTMRASDVGPQITKLIVRRGGVAIAGAGGIATAGSGGTAIVGPGGTAFTTPASSGGVAMVGPGGKVVKVSDLTDVLYGRTAANVAATGAGHATFTNKNGDVFTTSDNTGGVALVNPNGGFLGVSDDQNSEQNQKNPGETKEVQLPPGARLLTTGPIIYYNPVYPTNQL